VAQLVETLRYKPEGRGIEWGRLALMLRTGRRWIPTERLLRPQFRFWPPPRHRAVSWTLATFIEFRSQRGALLTLSDLHDFFQRAKRKLYQSRNRMRLVGNYLCFGIMMSMYLQRGLMATQANA
jgi:hypothetical protein